MSAFNHPENGVPLPDLSRANKQLLRDARHIIFAENLRILRQKVLLSNTWEYFAPYGASVVACTTVEPPADINSDNDPK